MTKSVLKFVLLQEVVAKNFKIITHTMQPSLLEGLPQTGQTGGYWRGGQRGNGSSWN